MAGPGAGLSPAAKLAEALQADQTAAEDARRMRTVRTVLASDEPPKYGQVPRGSLADRFEPQIRVRLRGVAAHAGPVNAERIGWPYWMSPLSRVLSVLRPEYAGSIRSPGPSAGPGGLPSTTRGFPEPAIPVGGQQGAGSESGDILSSVWQLINGSGR